MKHFLIVVDMQKDFVDGALGTPEAVAIVPAVCDRIRSFEGEIIVTYDTHTESYMETSEGKHLPVPHCIKGSDGWHLDKRVQSALEGKSYKVIEKPTFGSVELSTLVGQATAGEDFTVELIGLCTDICVVSNALIIKATFPDANVKVDSNCCAGVTVETHEAALKTMAMCQIEIV